MGKSILVVDDDELMRTFIATVLREDGYGVDTRGRKNRPRKVKNKDSTS
jgi:DNA-binding response OmpR family regulator